MNAFTGAEQSASGTLPEIAQDEEAVVLYVGHLLGWLAEHPGSEARLILSPRSPLPQEGIGMRVLGQKYPDRITYERVVHRLLALSGPESDTGEIHASVHQTPCDFRVTLLPDNAGVVVECLA